MKLAKLSLAAIAVASLATSSFAADSLADAFKNGKVSGSIAAHYWSQDIADVKDSVATFGLDLSYETARFNGFGLKATFQSSASPFADTDAKVAFGGDEIGSGAQLSEIYLSYVAGKTTAMVGRMYLSTPLVAGSGSRMNKEAFEGAAVINTDIANTTLIAGYVQKFQGRTDKVSDPVANPIGGNAPSFVSSYYGIDFDGAYTLAVINNSVKDLTLTAAYASVGDVADVAYAEASYNTGVFGLAAQYYYTDYDALLGGDDTNLLGVKANATFGAANVYAAYTTVDDAADVLPGLGNGADLAYTGSAILSSSYGANTDAYKVGVDYALMKNANVGASYAVTDDDTNEISYISLTADYAFEGALKGLGVAFIFDDEGKDGDNQEWRFNATYNF